MFRNIAAESVLQILVLEMRARLSNAIYRNVRFRSGPVGPVGPVVPGHAVTAKKFEVGNVLLEIVPVLRATPKGAMKEFVKINRSGPSGQTGQNAQNNAPEKG